ncbi:MAG: SIR2 family protein, partial [Bacteroidota bacterium]
QFDHYKKLHAPGTIQQPSKELPLIYNLLGSVADEESLLMTHNDLYDYFKSIFSRKSMPDKLKLALKNREINCFIFLGVPFEKWYMQLLLRELEIHRGQEDFIRYAANASLDTEIKSFCTEQFTIQFVENDSVHFVDTLYEHCAGQDMLRKRGRATPWEGLRDLIASDRLEDALGNFSELARGTELADEVSGLTARYRRFARKQRNGVLDSRDAPILENQITSDALDLIREAETL